MGTRIVVMKDGFIQQVDSPQVLYEKPVNVFVGGFIGSPPMNFVKTRVRKDEKGVFLIFEKRKAPYCRAEHKQRNKISEADHDLFAA